MKKFILLALLIATPLMGQRSRHVAEEWNTKAVNLSDSFLSGNAWHYLDWFGAYFQTEDWWIYHCDKGWLYPEGDEGCGVWLFWENEQSWVWTHGEVYPQAWNPQTQQWFNFCTF